ncbi:response regulator [Brachyspira aalborgi]|uniref:Response regulator n=1 Tax=Brachyspira aalborgi TaxID=29522 RepID=A0A5C8FXY6_9SPIR|nr:response regulator [Brachyspira aalborgi]TXJ46648.1 response regulator [Brachyspira aalborgi]TXJ54405.1 response regulator [Brachyspira aalborgi]
MINGKPLILAVDDEENIRNLITYTFEEHNLEVMTAENGKAAITILENNPIDVIITDLLMPTMTGLALIREMKKRKSAIPIIIITAYGNTEMVKEIIAEGVFRLIEKPLDFDILVPIVQDAIENKNKNKNSK